MKQSIILWLGAIVITFLSGYVESVTSKNYPVTGTIGIEGKKVSYKFDKITTSELGLDILLRTDADSLRGYVECKFDTSMVWQSYPLKEELQILKTHISIPKDIKQIIYRVVLFHKQNRTILQDRNEPVLLTVKGRVPKMIDTFFYLFLFCGLLLSARSGLEFFNQNEKIKKLSIFTLIFLSSGIIIFLPLKKIYEFRALGSKVLPAGDLIDQALSIILVLWIVAVVMEFVFKNYRIIPLIASILTIVLFQFIEL
ncbi:MAG: hypothetical protein IPM56_13600 [Ignavibacteriales bacterium]|nr:MAG: hypothetical protein IPM56_13600 [Ignavibacteriales bacterium]